MPLFYREYLLHIRDEVNFILQQSENLLKEDFLKNSVLQRAFMRSLEIIGEAVKQIPKEITAEYPETQWRLIARTRDKLIHEYFGVDYEIVWDIVQNQIPNLSVQVNKILKDKFTQF